MTLHKKRFFCANTRCKNSVCQQGTFCSENCWAKDLNAACEKKRSRKKSARTIENDNEVFFFMIPAPRKRGGK